MEDFQCFSDEQLQQMAVSGSAGAEDALAARYSQLVRVCARPYFLAGGLSAGNVGKAVKELHPFAVDVSSGIETDRRKDKDKMAAFVAAVRKEETL